LAAGLVVWYLVGLACGQQISLATGGWPAFVAASLALASTCLLLVWLSCPHAPACATALIFALGAAADWTSIIGTVAGVLLLTGQAVLINRVVGVCVPGWSPRRVDTTRDWNP
jgi:CBS-domain-containing membrane protein